MLQAIVRVDGEALVLHAGDKPYVVAPSGQVELASRGLTLEAVSGIVAQLLPIEFQNALDEFGAAQYELPRLEEFPGEHFTVVAARGGDDVWAEIRRRRIPDDDQVPEELFGPAGAQQAEPVVGYVEQSLGGDGLALPDATQLFGHGEHAGELGLSELIQSTAPSHETPPPVREVPAIPSPTPPPAVEPNLAHPNALSDDSPGFLRSPEQNLIE